MGSVRRPLFEIRISPVHGFGAFAARRIRRGTRIVEYLGERISAAEGDRRYSDNLAEHPHVLLFIVDQRTVIDGGVNGSEARFFNHSCAPNCEAQVIAKRVYILASRTIVEGEELTYDYHLQQSGQRDVEAEMKYACRCGAVSCRGTMLGPPKVSRKTSPPRKRKV